MCFARQTTNPKTPSIEQKNPCRGLLRCPKCRHTIKNQEQDECLEYIQRINQEQAKRSIYRGGNNKQQGNDNCNKQTPLHQQLPSPYLVIKKEEPRVLNEYKESLYRQS